MAKTIIKAGCVGGSPNFTLEFQILICPNFARQTFVLKVAAKSLQAKSFPCFIWAKRVYMLKVGCPI